MNVKIGKIRYFDWEWTFRPKPAEQSLKAWDLMRIDLECFQIKYSDGK